MIAGIVRRSVCAVFVCAMACAARAGEPPIVTVETYRLPLSGTTQSVDVYRVLDVPPAGVAVVAHGFGRSRARHRDLGQALAVAGIVAIVPDLPNVLDLWGNGDALAGFIQRLEEGAIPALAVERRRLVLMGTSAGGLAAVFAAADLPGLAGWIGLDPVDRTGTGERAAARATAPGVVMLADPSMCNLLASGRAIADALPRRLRTLEVEGASHCDFEDPTNRFCEAVCGRSSAATRAAIRSEIVRTALELLDTGPAAEAVRMRVAGSGAPQ